jgi:hypothetical protein
MSVARRILALGGLALLAAACGSGSGNVTAGLERHPGCAHGRRTTLDAARCTSVPRMRSLDRHLRTVHPTLRPVPCRVHAELSFYAANDWGRLSQALARHASPCTQYFISIPPIRGRDKTWTIPTPKEPRIMHRLGPNFHAMAEIRVWAWGDWLKRHKGKTWFDAGVLARQRMVSAGYDFQIGDIWAVNELPITLLDNRIQQKAMSELIRGLYQGGPKQPSRQGLVWRVVPFQDQTDLASDRQQLESWLREDSFWRQMSRYVRFWSSEVFAFPTVSCAGALAERTRNVSDYVESPAQLAEAGGSRDAVARSFLRHAYTPLENAAWQWTFGFGLTTIPAAEMARFVSLETYATAAFAKRHPLLQTPVRLGFAWAPNNPNHIANSRFVGGTGVLADRMATAIRASVTPHGIFPARACGRGGIACKCKVAGATLNPAWRGFASW